MRTAGTTRPAQPRSRRGVIGIILGAIFFILQVFFQTLGGCAAMTPGLGPVAPVFDGVGKGFGQASTAMLGLPFPLGLGRDSVPNATLPPPPVDASPTRQRGDTRTAIVEGEKRVVIFNQEAVLPNDTSNQPHPPGNYRPSKPCCQGSTLAGSRAYAAN